MIESARHSAGGALRGSFPTRLAALAVMAVFVALVAWGAVRAVRQIGEVGQRRDDAHAFYRAVGFEETHLTFDKEL